MPNNTNPFENLSNQNIEALYPELYHKLKPHIDEIAYQLRNQRIDENVIEVVVEDILKRSGLYEYLDNICEMYDNDNDYIDSSVAVRSRGFGDIFRLPKSSDAQPRYQRRGNQGDNLFYYKNPYFQGYPSSPADFARLLFQQRLGRFHTDY